MTYDFKTLLEKPDPVVAAALLQEERDAAWADFGVSVQARLISRNFIVAISNAGVKATTTRHMANMLRVYLQTGVLP